MKKSKAVKDLQKWRDLAGVGQFQLSKATKIDRSRLSLIENQHVQPTAEEWSAIVSVILEAARKRRDELERHLLGAEAA
jgi:hypothetical protein